MRNARPKRILRCLVACASGRNAGIGRILVYLVFALCSPRIIKGSSTLVSHLYSVPSKHPQSDIKMYTNIITFVALITLLTLSTATTATPRKEPSTTLTPDQILHVAPKSESCANPPAKGECATAEQAARNIALSFDTYDVSSRAEQAAVIGLMAFESEEFKYSRNHFPAPGVEGKGSKYPVSGLRCAVPVYRLRCITSNYEVLC